MEDGLHLVGPEVIAMQEGNHTRRRFEAGYSMVELMVVLLIVLALAAMAIPNLLWARGVAQEAAAVSALRTIATCQLSYQLTYQGYAPTLDALGPVRRAGLRGPLAADLLDADLATGLRSGYRFLYQSWDRNGDGLQDIYTVNAEPESLGRARRHFFLDQSGLLRSEVGRPADGDSAPTSGSIGHP